jgi:tripeptide aminopeptidase
MGTGLLERFFRYVSVDTRSDPASGDFPSTPGQLTLLSMLAGELRGMGAHDVAMDAHGYVTATIPATPGCEDEPVIGLLAHVDTSPDAPGANVRPQLAERDGDTIITSDGTTLLGADDKAGVAEIMTAAEILLSESAAASGRPAQRPHGRVRIAFTPDEEIGRGGDHFDVAAFGADFAYPIDGGEEGELEFENFNAAAATVTIRGHGAHPGDAKGKMINALRIACEFDAAIPPTERPETTEGYEGFFHLTHIDGSVSEARMEYIVRDHDRERFEGRKSFLIETAATINKTYGDGTVTVEPLDQYYNMREVVERHPQVVDRALAADRKSVV